MHHFFVDKQQVGEETILITGPDVIHIKQVLRMKCGEAILVSDQVKQDYICEISQVEENCIIAAIKSVKQNNAELPARVFLFQGLPKSDKMELIIQKAVELGVYQIVPIETRRVIVKLDAKKEQNKIKRWNSIAESAAKQSKRSMIPEVKAVMTWKEALTYAKDFSLNVIPYEEETDMAATRQILSQAVTGMDIGIFIGPEGGFERQEVADAMANGIQSITLGKRILRTETAGFTILSILMYLLEG